jgi:DNA-directed RNA polymerase subunit RPC12/RpoP
MNPIWTHFINDATRQIKRVCSHCRRAGKYTQKRPGQFYKCRYCGHRFQEKKK